MAIQVKSTILIDSVKVDAIGPKFSVRKSVPGGVAMGQDGPLDNYSGVGRRFTVSGITMRIRPTGIIGQGFNPAQRMQAGSEFDMTYNEGDPLLGGTQLTLQGCLARDVTYTVDNENGDIVLTVDNLTAKDRVPY